MPDEIIKDLWKIKDDIAREYGYDVAAFVAYLQTRKKSEDHQIVDLSKVKDVTGQKQ